MRNFCANITIVLVVSFFLVGNFVYAAEIRPNDPFFNKQWYLSRLNMGQVWPIESGQSDVVVAVIDTGVDISHPDLHDNIWVNQDEIVNDGIDNDGNGYIDDINGWDFIDRNNDPTPKYERGCLTRKTCIADAIFHGTLVSGVIAAVGNNSQGITGVNWHAKIMPLRALDENGQGTTDIVTQAVNYAVDNKANIINLSFVGNTYDSSLEQAISKAYRAGVLVVTAAGNEEVDGISVNLDLSKRYPVCFTDPNLGKLVLGVGATDENNILTPFSNYGSSCLDIMAPGQDFFGTVVYDPNEPQFSTYYDGYFSGTSLASPVIAGLAALMKAYRPLLDNRQIIEIISNNADNIDSLNPKYAGKLGSGLVDPVKIFATLSTMSVSGGLVQASGKAVYYHALDNKRYVFPTEDVFFSWFSSFAVIKKISDTELAQIPLGGSVNYRPGVKLVKIQSLASVYAISRGGVLHWINSESLAASLYGANWAQKVTDLDEAYFANYSVGAAITNLSDYNPAMETSQTLSIDVDKGLINP